MYLTRIVFRLTKQNSKKTQGKKKKFKIAVIKPYFYLDLYTKSSNNFKDIIYSSYYRFGPVGLFYDLNSDFFITKSKISKELKERIKKRIKSKEHKKLIEVQKKNSINEKKIGFNKYDVVLCYEGAVSNEIIKKNSKCRWGIILEDHSHHSYKKFLIMKPKNFEFFLNLTQGFTPYSFFRKNHCIDFSYTFGSSNLLKKLNIKKTYKIDVLAEIQQPSKIIQELNLKKYEIEKLNGNLQTKDYIKKLSSSKIFFCPIFTTPRWGNSIIEAAICKNLVIGNKFGYWNSILIDNDLHCSSISEGRKIIEDILSDKQKYNFYLKKQTKILDNINFNRPISQLYKKLN